MVSANSRTRFGLQIVFVGLYITPSHYQHCANLSEDIELIKWLSNIFYRVCKIRHILSIIHYAIHYKTCSLVKIFGIVYENFKEACQQCYIKFTIVLINNT